MIEVKNHRLLKAKWSKYSAIPSSVYALSKGFLALNGKFSYISFEVEREEEV